MITHRPCLYPAAIPVKSTNSEDTPTPGKLSVVDGRVCGDLDGEIEATVYPQGGRRFGGCG